MKKIIEYKFSLSIWMLLYSTSGICAAPKCDLKFKKLNLCGNINWTIPPKKVEIVTAEDRSEFVLDLTPLNPVKKSGSKSKISSSPNFNGDVYVKLWMPSMDHGSQPTKVTPKQEQAKQGQSKQEQSKLTDSTDSSLGKYVVSDVYFTMEGKWEIKVELKKSGKVVDHDVYKYTL